jgi:hypothetical protein
MALFLTEKERVYVASILGTVGDCQNRLDFIPSEDWTYGLAKELVSNFPEALNSIPDRLKTVELLAIAGKFYVSPETLLAQPQNLLTEEVYLASIREHPVRCPSSWKGETHHCLTLKQIPVADRTYAICTKAVGQRGAAFYAVPEKHQTYELCLLALKKDKSLWSCMPIRHKTYKLQKEAGCLV